MTIVCGVVGTGEEEPAPAALAEEVGRLAAKRGWTVVCGGLGGVMAAACRGAAGVGGLTVGILPGLRHDDANPWVKVAIPSGFGEARNALVVRAAHGLIAVGGGHGTLSEIALALKVGKPVVSLDSWDIPGVVPAADPEVAIDALAALIDG